MVVCVLLFLGVPREQGITALWRGNFANIMYIVPRTIAQFSFMENISSTFFPAGEKNISVRFKYN